MANTYNMSFSDLPEGTHTISAEESCLAVLIDGRCCTGQYHCASLAALLPKGAELQLRAENGCTVYSISYVQESFGPGRIAILPDCPEAFAAYFRSVHGLLDANPSAGLLFEQTVSLLLQWMELLLSQNEARSALPSYRTLAEKARKIILDEYAADLTLECVAERLFVNTCYLSTIFRRHTGTTFRNYLRTVRLQHAQKLVLQSNMQITDIALQVGFNSSAYLIRSFREEFGSTPMAMRQQSQSERTKEEGR